ncbi:MAG: DsbA family protein [Parasphingopyxis sp.]|uniref:DsbA family protein n=1 Tax=Parasphingopyxis sp. TaxID=1920299 RepID=UPI0032EADE95
MTLKTWATGALIALLAAAAAFFALRGGGSFVAGDQPVSLPAGLDRVELEAVIEDYILEHPEIIPQAMERLQQREMLAAVSSVRSSVETPYAQGWAGAANPDVTVVQFFDYACGYCRRSLGDIERLLDEDDGVRFVFRELPILSPGSEQAARVSLAAAEQGEYFAFHRAMYEAGRPSDATISQAVRAAGLDQAAVQQARDSEAVTQELQSNMRLASQLGINGTPVFVVGDEILTGAVGYDRLKEAIEQARTES